MPFDFSALPIVDAHAHPFMPSREKKVYGRRYILSSDRYTPVPQTDIENTLAYRMILIELARLLHMDPDSPDEEIITARNDLARKNYQAYVEMLFQDAGIVAYLNETGFPIQGARLRPEEKREFKNAIARLNVLEIIRCEMTCNHLIEDAGRMLSFDEFLDMFRKNIRDRVKNGRIAALKTVIGYFSGLEILWTEKSAAERSFYAHYYGKQLERAIQKPFRDFMVFECVRLCEELGLPLQIHTGAGDPPSCDLRLMRPGLLYEFLNREDTGRISIALLHGGYPFADEMAFMVNGYSNVVTDVSSMTCDDSIAVERVLQMLLEKIPLTKIMYGSDGAGDVDPIWFSAVNFKRVLGRVFDDLEERHVFTHSYGEKAARLILTENAERFYHL